MVATLEAASGLIHQATRIAAPVMANRPSTPNSTDFDKAYGTFPAEGRN
jgi:hypothetical protein